MRPVDAAIAAAREAGEVLLGHFGRLDPARVEEKAKNDVVSIADRESEAVIRRVLLGAFPARPLSRRGDGAHGRGRDGSLVDRRPARRHGELRARLPALGRLDRAHAGRPPRRARGRRRVGSRQEGSLHRRGGRGSVPQRAAAARAAAPGPRGRGSRDGLSVPPAAPDRPVSLDLPGALHEIALDPARRQRRAGPRLRRGGHLRRLLRVRPFAVGHGGGRAPRRRRRAASSRTSTAGRRWRTRGNVLAATPGVHAALLEVMREIGVEEKDL